MSGIKQRAPTALQVADRFHLLKNLAETLDQAFSAHSQALKTVGATYSLSPVISPESTAVVPVLPPQPLPNEQRIAKQRLHRQDWLQPS